MDQFFNAVAAHGDTLGVGLMLVSVLTVVFRGLATGQIVFKNQLDELRADKDAELARSVTYYDKLTRFREEQAAAWETAYRNEAIARRDQGVTLDQQLELARAADLMLKALPSRQAAGPRPVRAKGNSGQGQGTPGRDG